jgi:hypothetical protein
MLIPSLPHIYAAQPLATPSCELDRFEGCMASYPSQPVLFDRRLIYVDGRSCVQSVCLVCGAHIVGSITEALLQDEAEHVAHCFGRTYAA